MILRAATIEDLPSLETGAKEFSIACGQLLEFNINRFTALWSGLLTSGDGAIFLLVEGPEVVGAIGGLTYPEPYCGYIVAQEFFWFVREGMRGGGVRLYRKFEQWAQAKGSREIRMAHMVRSMPAKVANFYEKLGFERVEVNYSKVLQCQ